MKRVLTILILMSPACELRPVAEKPPDTFERVKDCAAQAEKQVRKDQAGQRLVNEELEQLWKSHYNPEDYTCYMYTHTNSLTDKGFEWDERVLSNAFEPTPPVATAALGADWGRSKPVFSYKCTLRGKETDCSTVETFIADHLGKGK